MKNGISSPLHFCTSLGTNSLPKLLALYWSLLRQTKAPFVFWVLCDGDEVYSHLSKLNLINIRLIPLADFEITDEELYNVKPHRDIFEYNCTLRPCWMLYILTRNPEVEFVTYMDTDLYFFSDPHQLYGQLTEYSILLSEHQFSKLATRLGMSVEISGIYNAGWLAVKNDKVGLEALQWWRQRCLEWCRRFYEDGKFGEQKYLDSFSTLFQRTASLDKIGGNVAPWNVGNYQITIDEIDQIYINHQPLIFYHFHALQMHGESSFKVVKEVGQNVVQLTNPSYVLTRRQKQLIYKPYIIDMQRAITLAHSLQIQRQGAGIVKSNKVHQGFHKIMMRSKYILTHLRSVLISLIP